MRQGFSLIMCAPDERKVLRTLLASLGRGALQKTRLCMLELTSWPVYRGRRDTAYGR